MNIDQAMALLTAAGIAANFVEAEDECCDDAFNLGPNIEVQISATRQGLAERLRSKGRASGAMLNKDHLPMKISQDVIEVLERAETSGAELRLTGQLDRKVYEATAKALAAAGGKWNTKAKAILFDGDAAEAIEPILLTGEITSRKVELQAFFTPPALAEAVAKAANILPGRPGPLVLEPSAGEGALARAARALGGRVQCLDIDQKHFEHLMADGFDVCCIDFLKMTPIPSYDRVVMNPPFTRQQDVKHVMHALKFLKPGGRLVAIMSPSWQFRQTALAADFRALLNSLDADVDALPEGSFKAAGTNVSTVVVTIDV